MRTKSRMLLVPIVLLGGVGLAASHTASPDLAGEWRAQLQFTTGAFAPIKDLEFMYVFNQGGTMTESSNYDASPPVPPAYGIWRKVSDKEYEAKYEFYVTKPPANFDEIAKAGGWGRRAAASSWKRSPCPPTASRSPRRSSTISSTPRGSRPRVVVWPPGRVCGWRSEGAASR